MLVCIPSSMFEYERFTKTYQLFEDIYNEKPKYWVYIYPSDAKDLYEVSFCSAEQPPEYSIYAKEIDGLENLIYILQGFSSHDGEIADVKDLDELIFLTH